MLNAIIWRKTAKKMGIVRLYKLARHQSCFVSNIFSVWFYFQCVLVGCNAPFIQNNFCSNGPGISQVLLEDCWTSPALIGLCNGMKSLTAGTVERGGSLKHSMYIPGHIYGVQAILDGVSCCQLTYSSLGPSDRSWNLGGPQCAGLRQMWGCEYFISIYMIYRYQG